MSVSLWSWEADKCDGDYCIGDCDLCQKAEEHDDQDLFETVPKSHA